MRFNPKARLDTSRMRDDSGGGGGGMGGGLGGSGTRIPLPGGTKAGGGLGIVLIIVVILLLKVFGGVDLTGAITGGTPGGYDTSRFTGSSAAFFALVLTHTQQGTFGDPYYGGNANFVGWDLVGYPGVRTIATSDDQRLGADVQPNHKSAYDYDMFTKA